MFYKKGRTAGYISVNHLRLEHFIFYHFVYFLQLSVAKFFSERHAEEQQHVFKLKINCLNNDDFNIDQNNPDYDFSHN